MKREPLRPDPEKVRAWLRKSQDKQREPKVKYRSPGPARTRRCHKCNAPRAAHWHHVLQQEHVKVYVRGLRLPVPERDALLRKLLSDPRNLMPLCRSCHGNEGTLGHDLRREDVPEAAWEFAHELGPEWVARLERTYP